jgi:hypothetical protein
MIATTRGLVVLAVVAALLGIAVFVAPGHRASTDRFLATQPVLDGVTSISVSHAGTPPVQVVREADGWRWSSDRAIAETATVDAILSTLRGAHWHRRAGTAVALPVTAELRLGGATPLVISRGRDVVGAAQTWLVIGDAAYLVDSWVAAALFPAPLALRVVQPLANASQARRILAPPLEIEGTHLVAPKDRWIDPAAMTRLVTALAGVELVALPPGPPGPPGAHVSGERVALEDGQQRVTSVERVGTCDGGRVLVEATTGGGCVEAAAWQAVTDAVAPLRVLADDGVDRSPAAHVARIGNLIDRRPLPIVPARITFADGVVLSLASPPRIGDEDADRQRAEELVAALSTPGRPVARPAGAPRTTLTASDEAGTELVLEVFADAIARRGEPVAFAVDADALAVIARPVSALRDPVRWREDPMTLSSLTIDGTTYARGAVVGEWDRTPAGTVDAALVDAHASALAVVRAPAERSAAARGVTVRVTFTPPAGKPTTHELSLGAPTQTGCPARIDGVAVRADLALCTAAHALAAR